MTHTVNLI